MQNVLEKKIEHTIQETNNIKPKGKLGFLNMRYKSLAKNTYDYWMTSDNKEITKEELFSGISNGPVTGHTKLQLYIHIPFCVQKCLFCAFSGGNHTNYKSKAESFSRLIEWEMKDLLNRTNVKDHHIEAVHIGGGSPNLLGRHIGHILKSVRDLPGCDNDTEIAVELALKSTTEEFIKELIKYEVFKVSFGLQTLDPRIRRYLNMPEYKNCMSSVLNMIDGHIPIINVDLINCLPGQTPRIADTDLRAILTHPSINAISSHLLSPNAAPALISKILRNEIPTLVSMEDQILMRLHSFLTLQNSGWIRKGTETYMDPSRISEKNWNKVSGSECVGAFNYESYLLGCGPLAVSYMPGVRLENCVNIDEWMNSAENGEHAFFLKKCSTIHQKDQAFWAFPFNYKGLSFEELNRVIRDNVLDESQLTTFYDLLDEGYIIETPDGYNLSLIGEVFKGRIIYDLKKQQFKSALQEYIDDGMEIAKTVVENKLKIINRINDRQNKIINNQ